jgi:hypothetical protein
MQNGSTIYTIEINQNGRREEIEFEGPDGLSEQQITQLADTHLRTARPGQTFRASQFAGTLPAASGQAQPRLPASGDPMSQWGRAGVEGALGAARGAGHVLDNAAEMLQGTYNNTLGHLFGQSNSATEANEAGQGFEGAANQLPQGSEFGNMVGQVGASALLTRRLPGAFLPGAGAGALMSDAETGWGVATDAAVGGAGGVIGDRLLRGITGMVAPRINRAARNLHERGVRMTPGQVLGGSALRTEDRLISRPHVGDQIIAGRQQSYRDFNRAAVDEVIAPYNAAGTGAPIRIPASENPQAVIRSVGDQLSNRYERLVPRLSMRPDAELATDVTGIAANTTNGNLSPAALRQFNAIVENQVTPLLNSANPIAGAQFRQIERRLGQQVSRFGRSDNPDHQAMAEGFGEMQSAFQRALQRSNPPHAQELAALNESWANLVRVEGAASGARGGLFSPAQFRSAVRRGDSSTRRRGMARGEARMQDLAEAAVDVLPADYPDSGTAGRAQDNVYDPRYWLGMLQGRVYTPGVQQTISNALLAPRPPAAQSITDLLRALPAPQAGAAGANALATPFFGPVP